MSCRCRGLKVNPTSDLWSQVWNENGRRVGGREHSLGEFEHTCTWTPPAPCHELSGVRDSGYLKPQTRADVLSGRDAAPLAETPRDVTRFLTTTCGDREGGMLMSTHYDRDEAVKPVIRSVRTHTSIAKGGRLMMHTSNLYAAFRIATSGRCLRPVT
jgi:hypothetical protein